MNAKGVMMTCQTEETVASLESYLQVGWPVVFQPDPGHEAAERFTTQIRGWEKMKYVLLGRVPAGNERVVPVHENQPCAIRFVHEGKACAFMTQVQDWNNRRDAGWVRVMWPKAVEVVRFRKHERVGVDAPCTIFREGFSSQDGIVRDVSLGGCGIVVPFEYRFGHQIEVSFVLPTGVPIEKVRMVIRNVRSAGNGQWLLGGEFLEGQELVNHEIVSYVASTLRPDTGVAAASSKRRVLLIEGRSSLRDAILERLNRSGFDTVTAENAVDGFWRIFAARPWMVIVSQTLADLSGMNVLRAIKAHAALKSLPVLLYGEEDEGMGNEALEAGAVRYVGSSSPDAGIHVAVMACDARERLEKQSEKAANLEHIPAG